jgi:hypothetical protein
MDFPSDTARQFLSASSALTGFTEVELMRTGMADSYWNTLVGTIGAPLAGDFLTACARAFAASADEEQLAAQFQKIVLDDSFCGPLARNIITMWYLGQWNALPREWCDVFGGSMSDVTHIVSGQAYAQGLVWPTFGGHPQGAKGGGWGSWAEPPLVNINTDLPA